jgi:hypothetical protein
MSDEPQPIIPGDAATLAVQVFGQDLMLEIPEILNRLGALKRGATRPFCWFELLCMAGVIQRVTQNLYVLSK